MHGFRLDTATDGRQKKKKHCVRQQLCCVDRNCLSELFLLLCRCDCACFMSVVRNQGIVTPSKGEGRNEFPVVSVSFLDDDVFLFSVTIVRR